MAHVYMTTSEHGLAADIARELLDEGVAAARIRVFSAHPEEAPKLPVALVRYRSPASAMLLGGGVGAALGALVGMPLLVFGGFGLAPMLVIVVAGAVGGAVLRLWFGHGLSGELYRLDAALRRGEAVVVLDVDDGRVGEVERKVKSRHPEVSVLGTDPEGTPPFP
jgi:hypothetical protein